MAFLLDQAPGLVGGNLIIDNSQAGITAKNIDLPSLNVDLNYFGLPQNVRIFSSYPNRKTYSIVVLSSKDYKGERRAITIDPFPESAPQNERNLVIAKRMVKTSDSKKGETAETGKTLSVTQADTEATKNKSALDNFIEGVSAVRKKDYPKAIRLLNISTKEKSREAESRFWLGFCYLETGQLKEAVFNYYQATKLDPDNSQYLVHLGISLYLSGQPSKAEIIYKEVLRREPDNKDAKQFLSLLHEK